MLSEVCYQQKVGRLFQSIADLLVCSPSPCPNSNTRKVSLVVKFSNGITVEGIDMAAIMRIDQKATLSPGFTDSQGNPVTALGSVPVWNVSDTSLATLEVSEDGMVAVVTPTGNIGTAQVNMTVDADPDDDVEEIVGTLEIEFKAGKARFVTLSAVFEDLPAPEPVPAA